MRLWLIATLAVALMALGATTPSLSQPAGSGWAMVPSPERAVKTLYWELHKQTEVWTRIVPRRSDRREIPANLIFWVSVSGKVRSTREIRTAPPAIMLLAQAHLLTIFPRLTLVIVTDGGRRLDLTAPGANFSYVSRCDDCAANAILATLPPETFRTMAFSEVVSGEVLGFDFALEPADLTALRDFGRFIKATAD